MNFKHKFLLCLTIIFFSINLLANNDEYEELIVTVNLNFEEKNSFINILSDKLNNVYLEESDLPILNLQKKYLTQAPMIINDKNYYNLSSIAGLTFSLNRSALTLQINILPDQMNQKVYLTNNQRAPLVSTLPSNLGLFVNYDLNMFQPLVTQQAKKYFALSTDLNFFSSLGIFSNTMILRKDPDDISGGAGLQPKPKNPPYYTRLETNYTYELPEKSAYIKLGDGVSRGANWSSSSRFAGVQYSTDFSIRPDIITQPLLNFSHFTELPGAVEIYNNSRRLYNGQVSSGAFSVNDIPVVTGKGELLVKMRDINGEIQTFNIPYYLSPNLLNKGIKNYSIEIGTQRRNFGNKKNDYKNLLINGDYMAGLTDHFTAGAHFEMLKKYSSFGLTNNIQLGNYGVATINFANNLNQIKHASRVLLGYSYLGNKFNFRINADKNGKNYTNVHAMGNTFPITQGSSKMNYQLTFGFSQKQNTYGISFLSFPTILDNNSPPPTNQSNQLVKPRPRYMRNNMISASYNTSFFKHYSLTFTIGKELKGQKAAYGNLSLNIFFDKLNYNISNSYRNKQYQTDLSMSSRMGNYTGTGVDAKISRNKTSTTGGVKINNSNSHCKCNLEVTHYRPNKSSNPAGSSPDSKQTNLNGNIRGSIVLFDKDIFFTRPISNSFALIKTPGVDNLMVLNNNLLAGYTDKDHKLLLPEVASYYPNNFKLHPKNIPFGVTIADIELRSVFKKKTGNVVIFETKKDLSAEMIIIDNMQKPLPVNCKVEIDGRVEENFIGFHGKLYLDHIQDLKTIKGSVNDEGVICKFEVPINFNDEHLINFGTIQCL